MTTCCALAALPAPAGTAQRLAAAVASGAGTRVATAVPPAARAAVTHAARAGTASGLNEVLLAAAAFAALAALAGFAFGPDPAPRPPGLPAAAATGFGDRAVPGLPFPRDEAAPSTDSGSTRVGEGAGSPGTLPLDDSGRN
jgi:hypothetical protein